MERVHHLARQPHVDCLLEVLVRLALVVEDSLRDVDDLNHNERLALAAHLRLLDLEEFGRSVRLGLDSCEYLFLESALTHVDDVVEGNRPVGLVELAAVPFAQPPRLRFLLLLLVFIRVIEVLVHLTENIGVQELGHVDLLHR